MKKNMELGSASTQYEVLPQGSHQKITFRISFKQQIVISDLEIRP